MTFDNTPYPEPWPEEPGTVNAGLDAQGTTGCSRIRKVSRDPWVAVR